MELKQLECFLAVSKFKSFTRAAEQLYISQPTVTTTIRRLEDELGIALFERNKKQAILTPEGKIFYGHITIVMEDVFKATQIASELKNLNCGTIKLGISSITSLSITSLLLSKFRTMYPSLKIDFIEAGSYAIKKMLIEDQIDLGLVITDNEIDGLDIIHFGKQKLFVYLPQNHRLKSKSRLTLAALRNELFILPKENCSLQHFLKTELAKQNITPQISFETNYIQMIKNLIISGSGIAILPQGMLQNSTICSIPLSPPLEIEVGAAKKKDKYLSQAAQTLYTFLRNSFMFTKQTNNP